MSIAQLLKRVVAAALVVYLLTPWLATLLEVILSIFLGLRT